MPLTAGARLGPFEVHSLLGTGGMGEVYRARDSRLKREVALKVLPEQFAGDADRLARFQREAELLATISHPNIAGLHGLEESPDGAAIVLELIEGETIAERIRLGPVPVDEALGIARQIADGLEAAHEKGVVHRDLKPANIKITPDGHVKILDFGLAKLLEDTPSSASLAMSPTLSLRATAAGVILGTAAYMSPEQARGRAVDRRTDIWAFGCVLFEMLTGRRAFESDDTISDVVAAILKSEVDWTALPADTPPQVRTLLRRCLQKDRSKRLPHIGLARIEIDDALAGAGDAAAAPPEAASFPWRARVPWIVAAAAIVSAVLAVWQPWAMPAPPRLPLRLSVDLGGGFSLLAGLGPSTVLSPDGELLALVGERVVGDQSMLFVRRLDQLQPRPLAGTEGATSPFFAPDSRWIAFFADGKLKKISVNGGAVATLCDAPAGRGGSWAEDDTIVFSPANVESTGLMRVSSGGGRPEPITTVAKGEFSHRWPQVLPGGKALLYTVNVPGFSFESASIVLQPLPSGPRKVLRQDAFFGRYVSSGHLLYVQDGTVFAAPFDIERLEATGAPAAIVQGIARNASSGGAQLSASDSGTLVYTAGASVGGPAAVAWLNRAGEKTALRPTRADWSNPRFSPDGARLAMDIVDGPQTDIWIYEWARDAMSRVTFDPADDVMPVWSPDGQWIVFASNRGNTSTFNLYWQRSDGSGAVQRLTNSPTRQYPLSWHPTENLIAYQEQNPRTGWDIMLLPLERRDGSVAAGAPRPFLNGPENESGPKFSPDGRWIAYDSNETGRPEVYVRPFPAADRKWPISAGGRDPMWSHSANDLFYVSLDSRIMAVSYGVADGSFRAEKPGVWSDAAIAGRPRYRSLDLHPDGSRFAVSDAASAQAAQNLGETIFIFNFLDELRRVAPVSGR